MPLAGLKSYPLSVDPFSIVQAGYAAYDQAQSNEARGLAIAQQRVALKEAQEAAAERSRSPQTVTLGAPAVPGIAAGPHAAPSGGGQLLSLEEAPQGMTPGVPAASDTVTEFPRYENPMEFANRRRKAQARVDAKQAEAESLDRFKAGDWVGFRGARARAYGHWMDVVDEPHRAGLMKKRDDDLEALVALSKRQAAYSEEAPRLYAFLKQLEDRPEERGPYWSALELIAKSDDPELQQFGAKLLQDSQKEYRQQHIATEAGNAVVTIETAVLRKESETRKRNVELNEDEHRRITLEVIQEHPKEFGRYMTAILNGKGPVPGYLMRFAFPGLTGPKEDALYQRIWQGVTQQLTEELGREPTFEEIETKTDERYSLQKSGQTPAAQRARQALQKSQTELAQTRLEALERKAMQEAAVGGGLNLAKVAPGTIKAISGAIKDFDANIAAVRADSAKSQVQKDTEIMWWEQSKVRLHGLIDRISQAQIARPTVPTAPVPTTPPPAPTTAPRQPPPAAMDLAARAKALYDADRSPGKGDWKDPAVKLKYKRQAEGNPK